MSIIEKVANTARRVGGVTSLAARNNAPTIMVAVGIAGMVGACVFTARSALKSQERVAEHRQQVADIKDDILPEDQTRGEALAKTHLVFAGDMLKAYSTPILIGGVSAAMILGGFGILNKRYAALGAAYTSLHNSYVEYSQRVRDHIGVEEEREIRNKWREDIIQERQATLNGDTKLTPEQEKELTKNYGPYSRMWDKSTSNMWTEHPEMNVAFLTSMERLANDRLFARGHLFLNEVYDLLGLPRTPEGQLFGWSLGHGEEFVDFAFNQNSEEALAFVDGRESSIMLQFNVHGNISRLFDPMYGYAHGGNSMMLNRMIF